MFIIENFNKILVIMLINQSLNSYLLHCLPAIGHRLTVLDIQQLQKLNSL
jgi:hypothetical protein